MTAQRVTMMAFICLGLSFLSIIVSVITALR